MLHSVDDDWAMPIASKRIVPPSKIPDSIASFAEALKGGKNAAVLLGNFAQQHPLAAQIHAEAQALGVRLGFLGEAANSVGGYLAGLPAGGNVNSILAARRWCSCIASPSSTSRIRAPPPGQSTRRSSSFS